MTTSGNRERTAPIQLGDWVALGCHDGRCPVGEVEAIDDTWIAVNQFNWLTGALDGAIAVVRWDDVEQVRIAWRESADQADSRTRLDTEPLAVFQIAWAEYRPESLAEAEDKARAMYRQIE